MNVVSKERIMADAPSAATVRPNFLQFLGRFEGGELVGKLTKDLEDLVAAMEQLEQDHGIQVSKGELVLTVKLARKKGGYDISAEVKTKAPKHPVSTEFMWANEHNSLVPENPRQQKLAFTEVVRPRGGGTDA